MLLAFVLAAVLDLAPGQSVDVRCRDALQPPAPTSAPAPTPRPTSATGCNGRSLDVPLGLNVFGLERERVAEGQTRTYCANIPPGRDWVRFRADEQCLQTSYTFRVVAPDGRECVSSGACSFVSPVAGKYRVEVIGGKPEFACAQIGANVFNVLYRLG